MIHRYAQKIFFRLHNKLQVDVDVAVGVADEEDDDNLAFAVGVEDDGFEEGKDPADVAFAVGVDDNPEMVVDAGVAVVVARAVVVTVGVVSEETTADSDSVD